MASSNDKQTADFDPYHHWLGIPKEKQPPSYYQLLGITDGESDEEVIRAAGVRQSAYVRNFQTGPHGEKAVQILNEIGEAIGTLADRDKRKKYEAEFRPRESESHQLEQSSLHEFEEFTDDYQYSETQQETDLPYQSNGFSDTYPSPPRQVTDRRPQRKRRRTTKPFIEQYWIWAPAILITVIAAVLISKQFGTDSNEQIAENTNEQIAENSGNTPILGKSAPSENPKPKNVPEKKTVPAENKPVIDPPPLGNPTPKTVPEKKTVPADNKPVVDSPPLKNPKPKIVPEKKTVPAENKPVIDLLKQINVRRSSFDGRWTLRKGVLTSPSGRNPKLTIANRVPAEYDLRMRVERLSGPRALIVIAPVDGYQVPCYIDYAQGRPGPYTGVGTYASGGPDEQRNGHKGAVLRAKVPVDIEIAVRKGSLTIKVESKVIYQWSGDSSRFQINPAWMIANNQALYLGVSHTRFRITRVELVDQTQPDGWVQLFPFVRPDSNAKYVKGGNRITRVKDLPIKGAAPGVAGFRLGQYDRNGGMVLHNGRIARITESSAAIRLESRGVFDDFELEMVANAEGLGGMFFLIGWKGKSGYLIEHVQLKTPGDAIWHLLEMKDNKAISDDNEFNRGFSWRGDQTLKLSVKDKVLSLAIGNTILLKSQKLENYKEGDVIIGTFNTPYGGKPLHIASIRVRER